MYFTGHAHSFVCGEHDHIATVGETTGSYTVLHFYSADVLSCKHKYLISIEMNVYLWTVGSKETPGMAK